MSAPDHDVDDDSLTGAGGSTGDASLLPLPFFLLAFAGAFVECGGASDAVEEELVAEAEVVEVEEEAAVALYSTMASVADRGGSASYHGRKPLPGGGGCTNGVGTPSKLGCPALKRAPPFKLYTRRASKREEQK